MINETDPIISVLNEPNMTADLDNNKINQNSVTKVQTTRKPLELNITTPSTDKTTIGILEII